MSTVQNFWHEKTGVAGQVKELLGGRTFFKWCCGLRMRRILGFQKTDGKTFRLGNGIPFTVGYFCEVCEARESSSPAM